MQKRKYRCESIVRKKSSVFQFVIVLNSKYSIKEKEVATNYVNILVQLYCKCAKVCEYIVILPQSHNNYPGTVPRFQICTVAFVGHVNGIYLQPNTIQLIIYSETVKYSGYTNTPTLGQGLLKCTQNKFKVPLHPQHIFFLYTGVS